MNVIIATSDKLREKNVNGGREVILSWSMALGLKKGPIEIQEIKKPSPWPPNRRKPGVTLPTAGKPPFKIMQEKLCPDVVKRPINCLNQVEPRKASVASKSKKPKKK